jgi:hypothetical protein
VTAWGLGLLIFLRDLQNPSCDNNKPNKTAKKAIKTNLLKRRVRFEIITVFANDFLDA